MLDPGPCHTCPLATGILFTPTGLHHTCKPEDWRFCNLLYRTSKSATQAECDTEAFVVAGQLCGKRAPSTN